MGVMGEGRECHALARLVAYICMVPRSVVERRPNAAEVLGNRRTMAEAGMTGGTIRSLTEQCSSTTMRRNNVRETMRPRGGDGDGRGSTNGRWGDERWNRNSVDEEEGEEEGEEDDEEGKGAGEEKRRQLATPMTTPYEREAVVVVVGLVPRWEGWEVPVVAVGQAAEMLLYKVPTVRIHETPGLYARDAVKTVSLPVSSPSPCSLPDCRCDNMQ